MVQIGVLLGIAIVSATRADDNENVQVFVDQGAFSEAENLLKKSVTNLNAPVTEGAAIQLEILRRIRYDFSLDEDAVLTELRENIPDVTLEDLHRWRDSGDLQHRMIDGQERYFRRAVSNLIRFSEEANSRRKRDLQENPDDDASEFSLVDHVAKLVRLSESSSEAEIYPVKHTVTYELQVHKDHPRVKQGAVVKAWLPFPQEYQQQQNVRLLESQPAPTQLAENLTPHRTVYFEEQIHDPGQPTQFRIKFEFVTSAYCPHLDPKLVEPYDTDSATYRRYTAERFPHIVFTSQVQQLSAEIVGDETNPLEKALEIFRWVSANIPWCSEMEYSTIANLSAKGLEARRGDCGVKAMTFITLCRAAGVPARWQSGWELKPGNWNMHDWAEFYVEPWGWLPADASYGVKEHDDPRVRDFFCGHMDPYRLIVNLDYGRPLQPPKTSFRSEPNDFQRGEIEIDGHNLYFDEWDWKFDVVSELMEQDAQDPRIR